MQLLKAIADLILISLTIISVSYTTWTVNLNLRERAREKKIKRFLDRNGQIDVSRSSSTKKCFDAYRNRYKERLAKRPDNGGLVIDKTWQLNIKQLLPLDSLQIVYDESAKPNKPKNFRFLPSKKIGFAENLIKYSIHNGERKQGAKYFFNGDLYAATRVCRDGDKLVMAVKQSDYFHFVDTCKILELEFAFGKTTVRKKSDIFDFSNRDVGIGINCLTIFKDALNDNGELCDLFLVHQRSSRVMESPGAAHVVPAGSFQPIISLNANNKGFNLDLKNTVYREFCEEIFHMKNMKELGSFTLLSSSKEYEFLSRQPLYFLGIGLEPLNTKMEVLTMLVIDCQSEDGKSLRKFVSSGKSDGGLTYEEVERLIARANHAGNPDGEQRNLQYEGDIKLEKFVPEMIEQWYSNQHATPSFREILFQANKIFFSK